MGASPESVSAAKPLLAPAPGPPVPARGHGLAGLQTRYRSAATGKNAFEGDADALSLEGSLIGSHPDSEQRPEATVQPFTHGM